MGRRPKFASKDEAFEKAFEIVGADIGFGVYFDGSKEGKSVYNCLCKNYGLNLDDVRTEYKKFLTKVKGIDGRKLRIKKPKPKKKKKSSRRKKPVGKPPAFDSKNEAYEKIYEIYGADMTFQTREFISELNPVYNYLIKRHKMNMGKIRRGFKRFLTTEKGIAKKEIKVKEIKKKAMRRVNKKQSTRKYLTSSNEAFELLYGVFGNKTPSGFFKKGAKKETKKAYAYLNRFYNMGAKEIVSGYQNYVKDVYGVEELEPPEKRKRAGGKPPVFSSKDAALRAIFYKFKDKTPSGLVNSDNKKVRQARHYLLHNHEMSVNDIISEYKEFVKREYGITELKPPDKKRVGIRPPAFESKDGALKELHKIFGKRIPTRLSTSKELLKFRRYFQNHHKMDDFEIQKAYAKRFHLQVPEKLVRGYKGPEKEWDFISEEHAYQEMMNEYDYDFPSNIKRTSEGRNFFNYLSQAHNLSLDQMKKGFNKYTARFKAEDRKFAAEQKRKEMKEKRKRDEEIIGNISSAENAFAKLYEVYGETIPKKIGEKDEAKIISDLLRKRYGLTDKQQKEEYGKYVSYRIRIKNGNYYQDPPLITKSRFARAIEASERGMPFEDAKRIANNILRFFHLEGDRIIDNVLQPDDRDLFYMVEKYGLLTTEGEETTLYDGREWRIKYWILRTDMINRLAGDIDETDDEDMEVMSQVTIYDTLPEDVWERS